MPTISNSILTMRTIAFLESLFAPTHSNFTSFGTISDWFPVQNTTPALHSTGDFGKGDWICIQFNLRACIPDETGFRVKKFERAWGISPKCIGLPLKRQAAKIPDLSRGTDQYAIEFLLSVSIVLRKRSRVHAPSIFKYDIVVWADYNTNLEKRVGAVFPVLSNNVNIDLGLKDCGLGGEEVLNFLVALAKAIDHWRKCCDAMMDIIDDIISVQLQDTLDKKRWNNLMFDDSYQLSEQHFTALQVLRIFQNWIGETEIGIQNLGEELIQQSESWQVWQRQHAKLDETQWPLDTTILRNNFEKLRDFFKLRVSPLQERIEKKKEEVASLQDVLLSASSRHEAKKAKTLNLYIGVFTTVTVFFTPLGFIATFWTIPFLATSSSTQTPSAFMTSFVVVPVLTYLVSAVIIVYLWSRSSRPLEALIVARSWNLAERVRRFKLWALDQLIWALGAIRQSLERRTTTDPTSV
ncbi:hypothetical protein F5Y19DRAFT_428106 [Xylariaceae sp. FL1651]|nr:hypothetical protein F5Y19DRAFT_428106 [Xylariaceae sp. FL1651]